jgi:uncharacterized protein
MEITNNLNANKKNYVNAAKIIIYFALLVVISDYIYKSYYGIQFHTRGRCLIYRNLPEWGFILFESVFEFCVVTITGIFFSVIAEKIFNRYKKWYPHNPVTAFLYASVIPLCGCSAIFFINGMKEKLNTKTVITFVLASPLLSPYIIFLSLGLLGTRYTILRIAAAFIITVLTGYLIELFENKNGGKKIEFAKLVEDKKNCEINNDNIYLKTLLIFKKLSPYLLIASAVNVLLNVYKPLSQLELSAFLGNIPGLISMMLIGLPLYLCNGADIIFLQPLVNTAGLPLGTAIAFSVSSTSICFTSAVISYKVLGLKLTSIMILSVFISTLIIGILINLFL